MSPATPNRRALPDHHLLLVTLGYVLLALWMSPGLFTGHLIWDERMSEYIPWRVEAARLLRGGEFPLFTDRVFGGMPLFSTAYAGVLYPPNWLYIPFPPLVANWIEVMHTLLAAGGMFAYLRARRLATGPAFVGGLMFASSLFLMLHAGHVSMREAACWAPLVALAARRLLWAPGPGRAALFAGALAMQLASGYAQMALMTLVWVAVEWLAAARWQRRFLVATLWISAAGAIGYAMLAVQILTAMGHVPSTPREAMTLDDWQVASLPPGLVLQVVQPRLLEATGGQWIGQSHPVEWLGALLPLGWALAAVAGLLLVAERRRWRGPRRRFVLLLLAGVGACGLLALGRHFPANALLFGVPPFNMFRVPARWLFLAGAFGAVLAAIGLQWLLARRAWQRPLWVLAGWAAVAIPAVLLWGLSRADSPGLLALLTQQGGPNGGRLTWLAGESVLRPIAVMLDRREIHLLLPLLAAGLLAVPRRNWAWAGAGLLLLVAVEWGVLSRHLLPPPGNHRDAVYTRRHPLLARVDLASITRIHSPSPDGNQPGRLALLHNTHLFHGLRGLQGYTPLYATRILYGFSMNQMGYGWRDAELFRNPTPLLWIGVSHLMVEESRLVPEARAGYDAGMGVRHAVVDRAGDLVLLRLLDAAPRFQLAAQWGPILHHWEAEPELWAELPEPVAARKVRLEKPDWKRLPPPDVALPTGTVEVMVDRGNRQVLRVNSGEPGGVLLIRDAHWPGWSYRIDRTGRWRPVMRAQAALRAVPVPAGTCIVEMRFRPPGWERGMAISLGAVAIWLGLVGWAVVRQRRTRRPSLS